MKEVCDGDGDRLVLWDVAHVRSGADWTTPPTTPTPSANPIEKAAYDNEADVFDTPAPCKTVILHGKLLGISSQTRIHGTELSNALASGHTFTTRNNVR